MNYINPITEPRRFPLISECEVTDLVASAEKHGINTSLNPESYRFAYIPDDLPEDTVWYYTQANPDPAFLEELRLTTRGRHPSEVLNKHTLKRAFEGEVEVLGYKRPVLFAPYSDEMRSNVHFAQDDRHSIKAYLR